MTGGTGLPSLRKLGIVALGLCACSSPAGTEVPIPNGKPGIGFDDLRYSRSLGRVLVPGGRSGVLALIEPETAQVSVVRGFSVTAGFDGGHDDGVTSVDEGRGLLFATDRTAQTVSVVDPSRLSIVASAPLGARPDYIRYVAATDELWVTEPGAGRIEIFALEGDPPTPRSVASISMANGPESLVIDASRGRAYTHRWQAATLAIDVRTRDVVAEWPNGCAASRGIDVDPVQGFVLASCSEGTASVLDAEREGRILSTLARGAGFDVLGFDANRRHLYLAGSACACLTVLGVSSQGELSFLGRMDAPGDTHCAVADDRGNVWVCDPGAGAVRRVRDSFAGTP